MCSWRALEGVVSRGNIVPGVLRGRRWRTRSGMSPVGGRGPGWWFGVVLGLKISDPRGEDSYLFNRRRDIIVAGLAGRVVTLSMCLIFVSISEKTWVTTRSWSGRSVRGSLVSIVNVLLSGV